MEPCWLSYSCRGHQKSFPVCLTNTQLVLFHHEGVLKTICLLGCSFMGCSIHYCIILFESGCSHLHSTPPLYFSAHPWLNNQKKVTFLRSDFHACSMLGRHFSFSQTFHVKDPSTQKTANPLLHATTCNSSGCGDSLQTKKEVEEVKETSLYVLYSFQIGYFSFSFLFLERYILCLEPELIFFEFIFSLRLLQCRQKC